MEVDEFFAAKRAPAVLKHGIIQRYLPPFISKVGSTAKGKRVVVVDGFAGAGRYADGSMGSAILLARIARTRPDRDVVLVLCEKKKANHASLVEALAAEGHQLEVPPFQKDVKQVLPEVLAIVGDSPAFVFLDPYGLGLRFEDVVAIMNRGEDLKTEVLLNFSAHAVRRIGGRLAEEEGAPGRAKTLEGLDQACGGQWWRELWHDAGGVAAVASELIANRYLEELCKATRSAGWLIEVKKSARGQPEYHLVYLTRHRDGLQLFGDQVSTSMSEWRDAVAEKDDLFSAFRADEEVVLEAGWVDDIVGNLRRIISEQSVFLVGDNYAAVMGSSIGLAREKHVRAALRKLYDEKVHKTEPKGKVWELVIRQ